MASATSRGSSPMSSPFTSEDPQFPEAGQQLLIGAIDFPGGEGMEIGRDHLISGGEDPHHRPAADRHGGEAGAGQHAHRGGVHHGPGGEEHLARPVVLPPVAVVVVGGESGIDLDLFRPLSVRSCWRTQSHPRGSMAPVMMRMASPGPRSTGGDTSPA